MTIQALSLNTLVQYKNNTQESWNKITKSNRESNSPVKPAANLDLPPLPPLPPSTPPNNITTNSSTQPTMSRASLNRLEVESGSSKSLPISFPYYFLDQGDPQDTFNLWQRQDDLLTNTSDRREENPPLKSHTPQVYTERIENTRKLNNDEVFNPVPKRFSQFIIDQQNPYVSQRLDNLSTVSPSMQSDRHIIRTLTPLTGANKKQTGLLVMNPERQENDSKKTSDQLTPPRREISDSMGSQATIFSTRQELHNVPLVNRGVKKSNTLFRRKNKSKRTSNVRVQTSSSEASNLTRKNAIRSKQGSWLYRLKVRLQRIVAKFKFYSFKVSSRRSASIRRSKSTKLVRKLRENPQNRDIKRIQSIRASSSRFNHISNPLTNPHLGKQPVFKVATIDDNLKYLAGAPRDISYLENYRRESQAKLNHLSEYIQQQEQDYMQNMVDNQAASQTSKLILPSPDFNDTRSELLTESVTTHVKTIDEPPSRQPPLPPPHLDNSFNSINVNSRNVSLAQQQRKLLHQLHQKSQNGIRQYEVAELWNSYLKQVLFKRIQLRQEINMFQNFMATLATSNNQPNIKHIIAESTVGSSSYNESFILAPLKSMKGEKSIVSSYSSHSATHKSNYSSSDRQDADSIYTTGSTESNQEMKDPNYEDEEFNKKVLNRRSMLGEMLEYLSEEEEDENFEDHESISSLQKTYSVVSSGKNSDVLMKTYGTVIRRSNSKLNSPLKRSFGLNHSLSSIVS